MATAREIKAKLRQQMEATVNQRAEVLVTITKTWERLEAAQADFETAARDGLALMPATEIANVTGVPAREVRAAAKRAEDANNATGEADGQATGETTGGA